MKNEPIATRLRCDHQNKTRGQESAVDLPVANEPLLAIFPNDLTSHPSFWEQEHLVESIPLYPNLRLARMLRDAAFGLDAIHATGLSHGQITPRSVSSERATGRVVLERIESSSDLTMAESTDPKRGQANDVADLAWTFAQLVAGDESPPPEIRNTEQSLRRWLKRRNPRLARDVARTLVRFAVRGSHQHSAIELSAALEDAAQRDTVVVSYPLRWGTFALEVTFLSVLLPFVLVLFTIVSIGYAPAALIDGFQMNLMLLALLILPYALFWEPILGWTPIRRLVGMRLIDRTGLRASFLRRTVRTLGKLFVWSTFAAGWYYALTNLLAADPVVAIYLATILGAVTYYLPALCMPGYVLLVDWLSGATWGRVSRLPLTWEAPAAATPFAVESSPFAASPDQPLPKKIAAFNIESELGRGGMGAVYKAWDTVLERIVALKVITPKLETRPELLRRFEREAQLAATLDSPNIAGVYGVGNADGQPYLAMEYVEGQTLTQLVERKGPVPIGLAWRCIQQAAEGLAEANRKGIIHRDVKPSNLMIKNDGTVVVTDFGVSKLIEDSQEAEKTSASPSPSKRPEQEGTVTMLGDPTRFNDDDGLTRDGAIVGTPMYMSPEQTEGESLDCRSDIYSLGLTLYFLLAGRQPFSGNFAELLGKQRNRDPESLAGHVEGFNRDHAHVLARMIAKNPDDRYQSYESLLADLSETAPRLDDLATPLQRVGAEAINILLYWMVSIPVMPATVALEYFYGAESPLLLIPSAVAAMIMTLVYWIGIALFGQTPGKWFMKLRVIGDDDKPIGWLRSLMRLFTYLPVLILGATLPWLALAGVSMEWINGLVTIAGLVSSVLTVISLTLMMKLENRRALHDIAAASYVVQQRLRKLQ